MKAVRRLVGSWTCPSGNSVDVFLRGARGVDHLDFEWDTPPPFLGSDDRAYYLWTILPEVHRRIAEIQERPVGHAVVITAAMEPEA